jgi:hypothetical protein
MAVHIGGMTMAGLEGDWMDSVEAFLSPQAVFKSFRFEIEGPETEV